MPLKVPNMRVRLPPEERAAEILCAAKQIARTEGLSALAVRRIAAVAQVAPSLVTHYFPLDELVAKAHGALAAEEYDEITTTIQNLPGPVEKIDAVLEVCLREGCAAVTFVRVESWAAARENPLLKSGLREQASVWHRVISGIIEEGVRCLEFHVESVDEAAWQLLVLIYGTSAHAAMRDIDGLLATSALRDAVAALLGRGADGATQRGPASNQD